MILLWMNGLQVRSNEYSRCFFISGALLTREIANDSIAKTYFLRQIVNLCSLGIADSPSVQTRNLFLSSFLMECDRSVVCSSQQNVAQISPCSCYSRVKNTILISNKFSPEYPILSYFSF